MSEIRFLFSEEFRTHMLDGSAAEANGGPVRMRKKKPPYVVYDGIRVETLGSRTVISMLWKSWVIGTVTGPELGPRDTLTIQGEAIQGRCPLQVTT